MKKRKLDFEDNTGEKEIRWEQRIGSLLSGTSGLSFHHWASTLCLQTLFSTSIFILEIQSIPHFVCVCVCVCVCCRFHICQFAKLMSIESVIPPNHLIFCRPLLLLPSIFPSIRVFSNESALHMRCPKYWSFSFNISPSNEHPGLISFGMDWFDLLAVQGTLKSLFQYHSSKASIL